MTRYKLTIEYNGGGFCGWQRQPGTPTIQGTIEEALFRFCGNIITLTGAGRTDSGVHASGQIAHFDLGKSTDTNRVRDALNYHLRPHKIAILEVEEVDQSFDARFSAKARHYHYRLINRRPPLVLERGLALHVPYKIDLGHMQKVAECLIGTHDFTTFRNRHCQANSPVKSIDHISLDRVRDEISLLVSARSFLHHQVRSIMGSLLMVGAGKWTEGDFHAALMACDRQRCGPVAPPHGLYLSQVDY